VAKNFINNYLAVESNERIMKTHELIRKGDSPRKEESTRTKVHVGFIAFALAMFIRVVLLFYGFWQDEYRTKLKI
jgi:hypothetical protein